MRIKFSEEKCVGCYACYTACIAEHHSPQEEDAKSNRAIRTIVKDDFRKMIIRMQASCSDTLLSVPRC